MKARVSKRELNRSYIRTGMLAQGFSVDEVDKYLKEHSSTIEEYLDTLEQGKAAVDKKVNEAKASLKADSTIKQEIKNFFLK